MWKLHLCSRRCSKERGSLVCSRLKWFKREVWGNNSTVTVTKAILGQSCGKEIQGLQLPGHIPAPWPTESNHKRPASEDRKGEKQGSQGDC